VSLGCFRVTGPYLFMHLTKSSTLKNFKKRLRASFGLKKDPFNFVLDRIDQTIQKFNIAKTKLDFF
jgi:hypothetical protein